MKVHKTKYYSYGFLSHTVFACTPYPATGQVSVWPWKDVTCRKCLKKRGLKSEILSDIRKGGGI